MPQDVAKLLDQQPQVLPANVQRVTADGKATKHLIDWETVQAYWFRTNIVNADQRITEVKSQADEAIARFGEDIQTLTDANNALTQQITSVEAKTNQATANGQIKFVAKAAPSGATAAFGLYLTAGNVFTGLEAIALSDGTSAIALSAKQLTLRDSGTAQQVFNYASGLFTFNVPIRVGTNDIGLQAVNAPSAVVGTNTITIERTNNAWQTIMSVSATGGSGQVAVVTCDFTYNQRGMIGGDSNVRWRLVRSDGKLLENDSLLVSADVLKRVGITRLDTSFSGTYTYSLQVYIESNPLDSNPDPWPYFEFYSNRGLMIDLRKR